MRSNFYTRFIAIAGLLSWLILPQFAQAQGPAHHVVIANGGKFGPANHVTIGTWDLGSQYTIFDSIAASSVQDLILAGDIGLLAADSFLVKYHLNPYYRLDSIKISGIRKLALTDGNGSTSKILVTRGFGASSDYVQAYDLGSMTQTWTSSSVNGESEGLAILGDSVYVAVPGSFSDTTGKLAVINVADGTLGRYIELGTNGRGIGRVYAYNGSIWTINALAFGSTTGIISQYEIATQTLTHHSISHTLGGGAGFHNGLLYAYFDGNLGTFDPVTGMVSNASLVAGSWAASEVDTANKDIFLTETDFFSYGTLKHYDSTGQFIDSLNIGISPEAIALDNHLPVGLMESVVHSPAIVLWPNPTQDILHIDARAFQ
ncbi:MAG TPA: hypothetical protein ENJ82_08550, partial [Bacteroidetes bacterium]|nr:hypothetical protein [Bacteroidota bacterium]